MIGYVLVSFFTKEVLVILRGDGYLVVGICKLMGVGMVCVSACFLAKFFLRKAEAIRHEKLVGESNSMLRMATMALNASLTAIAVVDGNRTIVMSNSAFRGLLGHSNETELNSLQLEDVLSLSQDDASMLIWAFQTNDSPPIEVDFSLENRIVRVTVSELNIDFTTKLYHIVLKDLTNAYALQQAVASAQRATYNIIQAVGARQNHRGNPHFIIQDDD